MLKWKTDRIKTEYIDLATKNPKLKILLDELADYVYKTYNKDVVLTEIYRSAEEYRALYAANPPAMPTSLPHSKWQAADLRSSIYSQKEIDGMLWWLNRHKFYGGRRPVALYHKIAGGVFHFHVQYGLDT